MTETAAVLADAAAARRRPPMLPPMNRPVAGAAIVLLVGGSAALAVGQSPRMAALLVIGAALGMTLYHAAFGFTAAWRVFIADRRGAGLRAQMVMLGVAALLFYPVMDAGSLFGQSVGGFVAPLSTAVIVGAFIFGVGMQLGGGCGSGTLFTVGGGNTRMVVTLTAFIAGSVIATAHLPWWRELPSMAPVSLVREWGPAPAILAVCAVFAAIALVSFRLEKQRHGAAHWLGTPGAASHWLRGPWPLVAGALLLAVLNFATLAVAHHPWGVTSGFTLWGGQIADAVGIDIRSWPYWANRQGWLDSSIFANTVSVMNFGVILGALLAAGLAAKFRPTWRIPPRSLAAAVLGGLMLGYGARLAYGCNIGAYFSGIASGSLHGWLWLVAAFAGNIVGTHLRPWFGLGVERTERAAC